MAKTFSRSRLLAKWIADETVTALRLAIVPKPIGMRRGVGKQDDHVVDIDRPEVRGDLRIDRLHALTLRAGAGRHDDLAGGVDPDRAPSNGPMPVPSV